MKTVLYVIYVICGILSIVLVMAHSGKGTGLSAGMRQAVSGSAAAVAERNINRITLVAMAAFAVLCLVLSAMA